MGGFQPITRSCTVGCISTCAAYNSPHSKLLGGTVLFCSVAHVSHVYYGLKKFSWNDGFALQRSRATEHGIQAHQLLTYYIQREIEWKDILSARMCNMGDNQNTTSSLNVEKTALAIPVLMFMVGVVGNVTAIAVLSKTKKERKESAFYTLVCGLAVTDLLGTCLASPITIATYLEHSWPGTLCEFHSFLLLFFGGAGLSIICTMSAERYLAISHPYTYKRWTVDQHMARWCLFAIYVGNVLLCCLPLLGFSKSIHQPPNTWCFIDWRSRISLHVFYSFLYAGISSLLILLTIACNVALCWTLLIMRQRANRLAPRSSIKKRWRERSSGVEIQMMLLLIVTSLVVLVCSTPLVVSVL